MVMTASTPASMAAWKGRREPASNVSRSMSTVISSTCGLPSACPSPGKCFATATTRFFCSPATAATARRALRAGSGPKVRVFRLPLRVEGQVSMAGAKSMFRPRARSSRPIRSYWAKAISWSSAAPSAALPSVSVPPVIELIMAL